MRKFSSKGVLLACILGAITLPASAGNKDRTGQAGASELLVNPWGRSSGVFGMDGAHVSGIEAMRVNIAGLASGTQRTEVGFSYNRFFGSADVNVANAAISQRLGKAGVLGVNLLSMNYGEIKVRTTNDPSGNGTYRPQFLNISVGFSREFAAGIKAGVSTTVISEQISNVGATGVSFDAGVQYTTGARDNFHFGVVLRNVGTNMQFTGQGLSFNAEAQNNNLYTNTVQLPSESFQMPTYLNLSTSYDFYLDGNKYQTDSAELPKHRLTPMVSFTSNSFLNDYIGGGVEYGFRELFALRGGYRWEQGIGDNSFYTGVSAGATVMTSLGKGERSPRVAIDYSFRPTQRPANGVHAVSLRFQLR